VKSVIHNNKGFTLTELMIAMVVGSIIMAVIYSTYQAQQKSYTTQHLAVEMQQNIRSAISLMKREIRMAGYDPLADDGVDNDAANGVDDPGESSGAGIVSAAGNFIQFSYDNNANSVTTDSNESLTYGFTAGDIDLDGIADDGAESLSRIDAGGGTTEVIAYDIQSIAFAYAFDDDGDGQLEITPGNGNVIWAMDADDDGWLDTVLDDPAGLHWILLFGPPRSILIISGPYASGCWRVPGFRSGVIRITAPMWWVPAGCLPATTFNAVFWLTRSIAATWGCKDLKGFV
jgi:prepilin-type N-terminal cleavage/methylation domain-containing protein